MFGRVVHIHSLPPIITLQLLVCLGTYFVLDRLFATFLSRGSSLGYHPHWPSDHGPRKMWFFSMKYYYLLIQESPMYLAQTTGKFHDQEKGTRICRGTSMVAVQFAESGLNNSSAPSSKTPWRLLVLTCSKETPEEVPLLRNAAEAFLWAIDDELTTVRRALRIMAERIGSIAVPSVGYKASYVLCQTLTGYRMNFSSIHSNKSLSCSKTSRIPIQRPSSGRYSHYALSMYVLLR